jgi:hypothetical protein
MDEIGENARATTQKGAYGTYGNTVESKLRGYIAIIQDEIYLVIGHARQIEMARISKASKTIGQTTAFDTTTTGAEGLVQRPPACHEQIPTPSAHSTAHAIPSPGQPLPLDPHCKMCNIIFYLWISVAVISLAVGLWRSFATSDEGKGFTDAAYIVAVGGLVIYPVQNRHALKCRLGKR